MSILRRTSAVLAALLLAAAGFQMVPAAPSLLRPALVQAALPDALPEAALEQSGLPVPPAWSGGGMRAWEGFLDATAPLILRFASPPGPPTADAGPASSSPSVRIVVSSGGMPASFAADPTDPLSWRILPSAEIPPAPPSSALPVLRSLFLAAAAALAAAFASSSAGGSVLPSAWGSGGPVRLDAADAAAAAFSCALALAWVWLLERTSLPLPYFVQDDAATQFLPRIQGICQALPSLQTWEPGLLLGAPTASMGTYAATYPGTWLSCAASSAIGLPGFVLDVFAALHVALGAPIFYAACRRLGSGRAPALAAALGFCGCGFFSITTRSWFYMAPAALFLPLLLLSADGILRSKSPLRWSLLLGASLGLQAHSGNAQMWLYSMLSAAALLLPSLRLGRAREAAGSLLLALAAASPILVVQAAELSGSVRTGQLGASMDTSLGAFLAPPGLLPAANAVLSRYTRVFDHDVSLLQYGSAQILVLLALLAAASLPSALRRRGFAAAAADLPLLLAAFWLAWTVPTFLPISALAQLVPPFSSFQHVFKALPFALAPLCLWGALSLSKVPKVLPGRLGASIPPLLSAASAAMALLAATASTAAQFVVAAPLPPPPVASLHGALASDSARPRVLFVGIQQAYGLDWPSSLAHSWPVSYGVASVSGYDPLLEATAAQAGLTRSMAPSEYPQAAQGRGNGISLRMVRADAYLASGDWRRAHSVEAVFFYDGMPSPASRAMSRIGPGRASAFLSDVAEWRRVGSVEAAFLREWAPAVWAHAASTAGPDSKPEAEFAVPLPPGSDGASVWADVPAGSRAAVFAFLPRPFLRAYVDGVPAEIGADAFLRTVVSLGDGFRGGRVALRYEPPWSWGWASGAVFAVLAALVLARCRARRTSPPSGGAGSGNPMGAGSEESTVA